MQEKVNQYEVMSTKMSKWMKELFEDISASHGSTPYKHMQTLLDAMIVNADILHPMGQMSPAMQRLVHLFESKYPYQDVLNLCNIDEEENLEVGCAIYCLQDHTGRKKDCRALMVDKPFMARRAKFTFNRNEVMERFLCLSFYTLYRRLRVIAVEMGLSSISELLHAWCDRYAEENMMDADGPTTDTHMGRHYYEQQRYKRHNNTTRMDSQTTIEYDLGKSDSD